MKRVNQKWQTCAESTKNSPPEETIAICLCNKEMKTERQGNCWRNPTRGARPRREKRHYGATKKLRRWKPSRVVCAKWRSHHLPKHENGLMANKKDTSMRTTPILFSWLTNNSLRFIFVTWPPIQIIEQGLPAAFCFRRRIKNKQTNQELRKGGGLCCSVDWAFRNGRVLLLLFLWFIYISLLMKRGLTIEGRT